MTNQEFTELLIGQGAQLFRDMPWRNDTRPYYVLVSELMLQQTQVPRVIPKFNAFIAKFPNEKALAKASLAEVLKYWQGLGYNRRAKYLHEAAKMIVDEFGGTFPESETDLLRLPGVGKNTAGALRAYSFNQPAIFIETNIRTVYIHHFFNDRFDVDDKEIVDLLRRTIDMEHPKEFYWALMDYGSWLKANGVRNNASSRHYRKQTPLSGSVREVRGKLLALLAAEGDILISYLEHEYQGDDRLNTAINGLEKDGLVTITRGKLHLTK